ncbi:leucine rich adaptor protein 1-like [Megalops cyprinoides]|uniref:leucine rich adaptor protein 1-like n=1 Tax=Megalops cyprinoides TaxID=118141 RepID=UPI00186451BD|nr:leucine rich adaptor protein 1-like [Megalops cyprinoides]
MEVDNVLPDFKDIESKLGRKVPEGLIRSLTEGGLHETKDEKEPASPIVSVTKANTGDLKRLENKMRFLKQEMAHLRAIDIKLMHQLLSINDGIESIKWVMEEKGALASRDSSLTGSLYSLSESQENSLRGSCNSLQDGSDLDGISIGSYLDTLAEDLSGHTSPTDMDHFSDGPVFEDKLEKSPLHKDLKVDLDEYYCFG